MKPWSILALALSWSGVAPPAAVAQGDGSAQAQRLALGRAVAENWCANCHLVGSGQVAAPGDAAPPFATIARLPGVNAASLRAFLQAPHGMMPYVPLSNAELDAVVAYILSLR